MNVAIHRLKNGKLRLEKSKLYELEKLRIAREGFCEEHRKKLSESKKGHKAGMTGRKHSPETIERMRATKLRKHREDPTYAQRTGAANKGRKLTSERREQISQSLKGRKQTQEHIDKRVSSIRKLGGYRKDKSS